MAAAEAAQVSENGSLPPISEVRATVSEASGDDAVAAEQKVATDAVPPAADLKTEVEARRVASKRELPAILEVQEKLGGPTAFPSPEPEIPRVEAGVLLRSWQALGSRKWLVLSLVLGVAGGVLFSLAQPPTYRASLLLELVQPPASVAESRKAGGQAGPLEAASLQTRLERLDTEALAERVLSRFDAPEELWPPPSRLASASSITAAMPTNAATASTAILEPQPVMTRRTSLIRSP